jgi:hypothetical protein
LSIVFDKLAMVKRLEHEDASTRPQAETLAEALNASLSEDMVGRAELKAELRQLAVAVFVTLGALMTFLRFFHGG